MSEADGILGVLQLLLGIIAALAAATSAMAGIALLRSEDWLVRLTVAGLGFLRSQPRRRVRALSTWSAVVAAVAGIALVPVSEGLSRLQESRVAAAEALADSAVTRTAALEQRSAPRSLGGDQKDRFVQELGASKGIPVRMVVVHGDPEAEEFAGQLQVLLKHAGWSPSQIESYMFSPTPTGLAIVVADPDAPPEHALRLRDALLAAGLASRFERNQRRLARKQSIELQVGAKPIVKPG